MGVLGDVLGFDAFALKDAWNGIRKSPERLLLGAADPWSTKLWNKALGKDWEPLVDQMGGPYGGHTLSAFGNNDGGVYARARAAGMDTGKAETAHDAAHVLSAFFGGQGLLGGLSGAPATGGSNLGIFANGGRMGLQLVGGGNAGVLAANHGIAGGAGIGTVGSGQGLLGMQGMPSMPNSGGQQEQQAPPPSVNLANSNALLLQMRRNQRAQELRRKTNRTLQENEELRGLTIGPMVS